MSPISGRRIISADCLVVTDSVEKLDLEIGDLS